MVSRRIAALSLLALATVAVASPTRADDAPAQQKPSHRVAAIYFHRTQRCPTCLKISAYIEEAIQSEFGKALKEKTVSLHLIDFQNPKNQSYVTGYRITGPTLVLADVRNGKVAAWKPMPKVWSLVGNKSAFFKYVDQGVRGYLEQK